MKKTLDIKSVCECNRRLGCKTLHPQASIINLEHPDLEQEAVKFEFYAVLLIEECPDGCGCCGRKYYDYTNATMVFLKPGEIFRMNEAGVLPDKGWLLAFHPDLLYRTSLKNHIRNYTFFSYAVNEALHLSDQERGIVMDCLEKISIELEHAIDKHSKALIAMNIELLLNYCMRFYERQFITRSNANKDALSQFEQLLEEYFQSQHPMQDGLPSVKYFADKVCLSPNYFGDMIKKETGRTPQEHIQEKVIELAKEHITETDETVSQIAYTLGFQYPQHLCRLFKRRVGCTPNEYRLQQGQLIQ